MSFLVLKIQDWHSRNHQQHINIPGGTMSLKISEVSARDARSRNDRCQHSFEDRMLMTQAEHNLKMCHTIHKLQRRRGFLELWSPTDNKKTTEPRMKNDKSRGARPCHSGGTPHGCWSPKFHGPLIFECCCDRAGRKWQKSTARDNSWIWLSKIDNSTIWWNQNSEFLGGLQDVWNCEGLGWTVQQCLGNMSRRQGPWLWCVFQDRTGQSTIHLEKYH